MKKKKSNQLASVRTYCPPVCRQFRIGNCSFLCNSVESQDYEIDPTDDVQF